MLEFTDSEVLLREQFFFGSGQCREQDNVGSSVSHGTMGLKVFSCMNAGKQGGYTNNI